MKMREFINAIDQSIDLTEAEQRIAEMNPELSEAPSPPDWQLREQWGGIEAQVARMRNRLRSFRRSVAEDTANFDEETAQNWRHADMEVEALLRAIDEFPV